MLGLDAEVLPCPSIGMESSYSVVWMLMGDGLSSRLKVIHSITLV
jgi:hypothetical protein